MNYEVWRIIMQIALHKSNGTNLALYLYILSICIVRYYILLHARFVENHFSGVLEFLAKNISIFYYTFLSFRNKNKKAW